MKRSLEDGGRLHTNICRRLRSCPSNRLARPMDEIDLFLAYELEGAQTLAANDLVGERTVWIFKK
jgi:hypothetical protein